MESAARPKQNGQRLLRSRSVSKVCARVKSVWRDGQCVLRVRFGRERYRIIPGRSIVSRIAQRARCSYVVVARTHITILKRIILHQSSGFEFSTHVCSAAGLRVRVPCLHSLLLLFFCASSASRFSPSLTARIAFPRALFGSVIPPRLSTVHNMCIHLDRVPFSTIRGF